MDSLNLSDFVSDTITEIAKGVEQSKLNLKEYDVLINPATDSNGLVKTNYNNNVRMIQNVEFDLSVTINKEDKTTDAETKEVNSKIQVVSIFNFSLGGSMSSENTEEILNKNSVVNRIKFSIPVSFSTNSEGTKINPAIRISSI